MILFFIVYSYINFDEFHCLHIPSVFVLLFLVSSNESISFDGVNIRFNCYEKDPRVFFTFYGTEYGRYFSFVSNVCLYLNKICRSLLNGIYSTNLNLIILATVYFQTLKIISNYPFS